MPQDRIIICMKWGTLYSADYVNVLYSACRKNMSAPFRFVCFTDVATGLDPAIEVQSIPALPLQPQDWFSGAWPKLAVFGNDLHGIDGRCLFIDLDSVICGPLDPFFELPGRLLVLDGGDNWHPRSDGSAAPLVATGVFAFTAGTLGHILSEFARDPIAHVQQYRLEQAFVGAMVPDVGFWPRPWVQSFKRHLRQPPIVDRLLPPKSPPPEARIVAFHGEPRPIALIRQRNWAKFPRAGRGPVDWMVEYWTSNGGTIPDTELKPGSRDQ